ncbi:MAG TPA: MATE family efflux transporter [Thermomicrobiales bacterium]|nr:MATE family efflux transporter [Thermomicrobiales bacterium]
MTDVIASESTPPEVELAAVESGPMDRARVLGLAVPIIGENLLQTLVGAVDTLLVARLGSEAVAGVGTAVEFVYFIISILIALEIGATVLVSQAYGAGLSARVRDVGRQALVWGVLVAIPVSIAGYVLAPSVIGLFGAEPEVADYASHYLRITAAMSVFLLLTFVGGAIFRGVGDSRTPLAASIVGNIVNLFLAYGLIFGHFGLPELGVEGSAWGAAIARMVTAGILIGLLLTGRRGISLRGSGSWRPHVEIGKQLLRLGLPASFEQVLSSAGFMTMLFVVAKIGTDALAAQQIAFTALNIGYMPAFGFGIAVTALVGQSIGANRIGDAGIAARIGNRISVVALVAAAVVFFVLASPIMHIFTDDPDVVRQGVSGLRALSISLPFWGTWFVYGGALRGTGDTVTPLVTEAVAVWSAVLLGFLAVHYFDAGLGAVWGMFIIVSPLAALVNGRRFRHRLERGIFPAEAPNLGHS